MSRKFRVINRDTRQSKIMSTSEFLQFSKFNNMQYYAVSRHKPKYSKCMIVGISTLMLTAILQVI